GTDPPRLSNLGRRLRQTLAWRLRLHYPGRSHRTTVRGAQSLRSQAIFLQAYRKHLEVQHQSEFVTLARRYAPRNGNRRLSRFWVEPGSVVDAVSRDSTSAARAQSHAPQRLTLDPSLLDSRHVQRNSLPRS